MRSSSLLVVVALTLAGCAARSGEEATIEAEPAEPAGNATPAPARVPGSGNAEGALGGTSMTVADAVVFLGPLSEREPNRRGARILLTTDAGACTRTDTVRAGGAAIHFDIDYVKGALVPGTYSVPGAFAEGPDSVFAQLDAASATCQRKVVVVQAGKVTIATTEAGRVHGTFELTTGHDTIKGSFDAAPCAVEAPPPLAVRCEP